MKTLFRFIIQGETPSKKNSRINTSSGRSFPSKRYQEWHKTAVFQIMQQLKTYGYENKNHRLLNEKTIVFENENHSFEKSKPNYNYNLNVNYNLNDNVNYNIALPLPTTEKIKLTFTHGDLRRRDSDNATSSIFDLLQDCGILEDDSIFVIPEFCVSNRYEKNKASCLIEIEI